MPLNWPVILLKTLRNNLSNKFFYTLFFSFILLVLLIVPLFRFWQYENFYYDFGIFDRVIYKLSHFQTPLIDKFLLAGTNYLSDHFTISLVLLIPFYWLFPKTPEILLVIQSLSVWLAGIVGFLIIKDKLKNAFLTTSLLFAFYYYLGLQNAVITEFHSIVVAVLPLMLMFWAIYKKKAFVYCLMLALFLGFKENMGFFSMFVGLFLLYKKQYKQGLLTMIISFLYSLAAIYLIIPRIGHHAYLYPPVYKDNLWLIIKDFFQPFIKLKTTLITFASFGFLPAFFLPLSLGILFDLASRFSLNDAPSRWDIGMHYNILYAPFLLIASFEIMKLLKKRWGKKAQLGYAFLILFMTLFLHKYYHGPFGLFFNKVFWQNTSKQEFMIDFIKQIPRNQGLLMAQNNIAVRFTRQDVVLLKNNYSNFSPDIIVIDLREGQNPNNFYPLRQEDVAMLLKKIKADPVYENIYNVEDNRYIFVKNKQK